MILICHYSYIAHCFTVQTFIGQRYGSRPLPAKIADEEMQQVLQCLQPKDSDLLVPSEDLDLLKAWYRKDDNAVPVEYVLQPIKQMAQAHNSKVDTEVQPQDLWKLCEPVLARTLRKAAQTLQSQGAFTTQMAQKYIQSGTNFKQQVSHLIC